ncbi:MAG: RNA-binding cell elongation regulator Jag/EloR [Anaerococcus sp.]|nr:Jag N-terminal domain-containing protein [Peptoniphilaceae bacterium]MDY3055112.1 RNA-binding cell elongation regulator Jag/EloR [Anaerococcus sp.]
MKKTIIKSAKTKDQAIKEALLEINKTIDEVSVEVLEEESSGFLGLIGQKDALVKISYEDDFKEDLEQIKEDLGTESLLDDVEDTDQEVYEEEIKEDSTIDTVEVEEDFEKEEDQARTYDEIEDEDDEDDESYSEADRQKSNIEKYYRAKDFFKEILESMHFDNVKVIGNLEGNIIKLDAKIDERDTGIAIGKGGKTIDAIELVLRKSLRARANDLKINIDINNYKKRRDDKIIDQADRAARRVLKTKKRWNLKYMNSYERRLAHEQISKYDELTSYSEGQEPNRYVVVDIKE